MTQDVWIFCELVKVEPVRLEMTGPKSVPLGSEAQYRAFLYYNNGTVEDVTTRANWSAFISAMWPSALGPVTGGMFRAYEEGPGSPHVEYRGFEAGMFVSVTPVGTFLIGGVVTAADVEPPGNYLPGAAILATSSAGPGKVIWHSEWDRGFFIVGVAGAVRLEVSHPGYVTRIINLTVTDLTYIGIELQRQ